MPTFFFSLVPQRRCVTVIYLICRKISLPWKREALKRRLLVLFPHAYFLILHVKFWAVFILMTILILKLRKAGLLKLTGLVCTLCLWLPFLWQHISRKNKHNFYHSNGSWCDIKIINYNIIIQRQHFLGGWSHKGGVWPWSTWFAVNYHCHDNLRRWKDVTCIAFP